MATIALMGPPGSGKTTMAVKTAVRRPVHLIDIDRKFRAQANLRDLRDVTVWELRETLSEDSLASRIKALAASEKGVRPPKGYTTIANYIEGLEKDSDAQAAGTIVFDSTTQFQLHMREHMQFLEGKTKLTWDSWAAWGQLWREFTVIMIDYAIAQDKDLIFIFHERVSEVPGDKTDKVVLSRGEKGSLQRDYVGTMNVKIAGAIEGAFGLQFGTFFTDVYALYVEIINGVPQWRCRVLPDGKRDLRCSFDVSNHAIWTPDLSQIWGKKIRYAPWESTKEK